MSHITTSSVATIVPTITSSSVATIVPTIDPMSVPTVFGTIVPTIDETTDLDIMVPQTDPTTDRKTVPTMNPATVPYGSSTTHQPEVSKYESSINRGQVFYGCCYDVRRTVMILDFINAICAITFLVGSDSRSYWLSDVINIVGSCIGIYGAWKYNRVMVLAAVCSLYIALIVWGVSNSISMNVMGYIVFAVLLGHPHCALASEIRNGIMTPETWPDERNYFCGIC